ncbi:MAG: TetR family transcriptional regulator [Acidimicrobiales bacterium]|jgi:AcrR family transcriptional regulator|nr:TetR family transcriptional regulator [Acidimicrobiales bacterium]
MPEGSNIGKRRVAARADSSSAYGKRRLELIHKAKSLFRSKGYHATSLKDLAELVGGDRASIYYYFSSKRDLFEAIVEEPVRGNVTTAEHIRDSDVSPRQKLREIIIVLMKVYDENYPDFFVFLQEDPARLTDGDTAWTKKMTEWSRRYYRAVQDIINEGLETGEFRSNLSARLLAHGILGTINWSHRWYKPGLGTSAEDIGAGFADMIVNGLAAPAKRSR